jgi:hypothetical protein
MTKQDLHSINIDALRSLRSDSTTAWIAPDGVLHVVPLFKHLSFFIKNTGILPEASSFLAKFVSPDGGLKISGQHMAEAMDIVYGSGWGRVGTFGGDRIELDCASEHLKELRRKTKFIARLLNRALVCRVAEPFQKPNRNHEPLPRDKVWSSFCPGFSGWLSPGGGIFECPPQAPFATFVDDPDRLPGAAKAFADAVEEDGRRQSHEFWECSHDADPEGHIEWHRYEQGPYNPEHDERAEMTGLVLSYGWGSIRVREPGIVRLESLSDHLPTLVELLSATIAPTDCLVESREWPSLAAPVR